jgi:hypothetical protein
MVKRITLKSLEYTAACITVTMLFIIAETGLMIVESRYDRQRHHG